MQPPGENLSVPNRALWVARAGWSLLFLAISWIIEERAPSPLIVRGAILLLVVVSGLALLARIRQLPAWHDWLWAMVALPVLSLAAVLTPAGLPLWLLLGLFVLWDVAQSYGLYALLGGILFPLPALLQVLEGGELPRDVLLLVGVWAGIALLGMVLPRTRAVRVERVLAALPDEAVSEANSRLSHLLVQAAPYDILLAALVRLMAELLDEGGRRQARVMALLYSPHGREHLRVEAVHNLDQRSGEQMVPVQGVLSEALQAGTPLLSEGSQPPFDALRGFRDHHLLLLPLAMSLDVYGAIVVATPDGARLALPKVQQALASLAVQASMALHNAALHQDLRRSRAHHLLNDEETRHQLARDLHDGPVQRVAAIAMQLEFIKVLVKRDPARSGPELDQLQAVANQAAQEMRTMLFTLRPVVLETEGISSALAALVARLREQEHLDISFQSDPLPALPAQTESGLFAIMQEAIGNAKKYAQGKPIHVRLIRGSRMLIGQVEDSGPGFDLPAVMSSYGTRASLGLLNMQERAALIGGELRIDTAPEQGTLISIALPLAEARAGG